MRRATSVVAFLAIFAGVGFMGYACTGIAARDNVLMPVVIQQYEVVVMPLALEGAGDDAGSVADVMGFLDVLKSGDRGAIDPGQWFRIKILALTGIVLQLGNEEIGPYGAEILRESIRRMDANIQRLLSR